MNLLDQIRAARDAERLAPVSQATLSDISKLGTGVDPQSAVNANGYEDRVAALLHEANNFEILRAYQHNNGAIAKPEIQALAAEIRRRNILL